MNRKNNTLTEIAAEIKKFRRIYITTHSNPEGDAIGSSLALLHVLEGAGFEVRFSLDDPVPCPLNLLPYAERAQAGIIPEDDELVIVLDCPNISRTSSPYKQQVRSEAVINIDHHLDNDYFGAFNYVDSEACATGEPVYFLLEELGYESDLDTAILLYTAILTDTGSFRFANTNQNAFKISYELTQVGLDPHYVAQLIYENYSLSKLRLLGHALSNLEISQDGRVGWIMITQDALAAHESQNNEVEGFVNYPRFIKGVIVSAFFHELNENKVKVSFRSKGLANVAEFAKQWGGGGHRNAAACVLQGSISEVCQKILQSLLPEMAKSGLEVPNSDNQAG